MKRKTIDIEFIRNKVNEALKYNECPKEVNRFNDSMLRFGIISLWETIAHETGNYKGFNNLPEFPEDDSRRNYY